MSVQNLSKVSGDQNHIYILPSWNDQQVKNLQMYEMPVVFLACLRLSNSIHQRVHNTSKKDEKTPNTAQESILCVRKGNPGLNFTLTNTWASRLNDKIVNLYLLIKGQGAGQYFSVILKAMNACGIGQFLNHSQDFWSHAKYCQKKKNPQRTRNKIKHHFSLQK